MEKDMHFNFGAFGAAAVLFGSLSVGASAQTGPQTAPPSYVAAPDTYKLVSENEQFRVIAVTRAAGHRDAWHSHAGAAAVYMVTDCMTRLHLPDGKTVGGDTVAKAGTVNFNPPTPSHSAENTG